MQNRISGPVVALRNVSIYNADDTYGKLSVKQTIQQGELVLGDISLEINPGEFVYLIGRVGSGKSSLLKTLYAEIPLMIGEAHVAGFNLSKLKNSEIPYLRRKMGIVFQDYHLLDDRNAFQNLHYVMKATGWKDEEQIRARISQVLGLVNLQTKGHRMPYELSGGEQQRLVIARALINAPDILIADEPTANLDPVTAEGIMEVFHKITENGCAVLMSTHNTNLLANFPARALLLSQGQITEVDLNSMKEE
ncbi:MAG: ATP-binding cassette domain-containing protein [Rikenellaceae bacterium]